MDLVRVLGWNVREQRKRIGMSQEDLAHEAGMKRSYVSDLERGTRNPTVRALGRLADALGVRPPELLEDPAAREGWLPLDPASEASNDGSHLLISHPGDGCASLGWAKPSSFLQYALKGTTGGPGSVLLTRNEVALHRTSHPRNALLVVHGISLSEDGTKVSGEELAAFTPWALEEERLSPICYEYRLA